MDEEIKSTLNGHISDLILEVQIRPELWNTSTEEYKIKELRGNSWRVVCGKIFEDFDCRGAEEQELIQAKVYSKWKTLRDGFRRSQKQGFSSTALSSRNRHLLFLDKSIDSASNPSPTPQTSAWIKTEQDSDVKAPSKLSKSLSTKAVKPITFKSNPVKKVALPEDDDDVAFFKSCLPSVKTLSHSQKIKLRISIMDSIQKALEEKDDSSQEASKTKAKRKRTSEAP